MSETPIRHQRDQLIRDIWLVFGDIRGFNSIEEAILSGNADIVRLNAAEISSLRLSSNKSAAIPAALFDKSHLPFAGAASFIDDIQELAHWVNEHIGRANSDLLCSSRLISNKETLYRLLEAQGIFLPVRLLGRDLLDLVQVLRCVDLTLDNYVVKPVVGTESRGVYRPNRQESPEEVGDFLGAIPDVDPGEPFLAMPYISPGGGAIGEYCLDGIVVRGRVEFCAVHEKTRVYNKYPIHDRAMLTPPANPIEKGSLEGFLASFGNAFPVKSFVFHLEVRLDKNGEIVPIDLSFRPGGGLIFKSIVSSYGVDLRLAHIYCVLGMQSELHRIAHAHHVPDRFTAIAAVFSAEKVAEDSHKKLSRLLEDGDKRGGVLNFDLSNVSILSPGSQELKPNVGLSIFSLDSAGDCLDRLSAIVEDMGMSFVSPREKGFGDSIQLAQVAGTIQAVSCTGDPIVSRIAKLAREIPDTIAIVDQERFISYAKLDAMSSVLGHRLRSAGVQLETPVGLLLDRSVEFIVAALAVLKTGGCYVPLDSSFPRARLDLMVEDAGIRHLVTNRATHSIACGFDAKKIPVGLDSCVLHESGEFVPEAASPENLACILYTSGSTGVPKGIAVTRSAVANLVTDQDYFRVGSAPCVLHSSSIAFDAASFEIWAPLLNGGCCVVNPDSEVMPAVISNRIRINKVNLMWLNASLLNTIVEDAPEMLEGLETVIAGGEVVSAKHFRRAQQRYPGLQLLNGYGPTEATTFACTYQCPEIPDAASTIPIGLPIGGVEVYVLDKELNEVRHGSEGELYIGGKGLARGYIGRPALTAESFVPHPFSAEPGTRLYKTGDRVRRSADGCLEFIGRADRQVKIRGFRVELDEVEQAIRNLPGVQDVVVGAVSQNMGGNLAASIKQSSSHEKSLGTGDVKSALELVLPSFMIPARIDFVDSLGHTITGKRASPPEPDASCGMPGHGQAEGVIQDLAGIWAEVLDYEWPSAEDDFFLLGGHSLSATRVLIRVRDRLGVELQLRELFMHTRLVDLANLIASRLDPLLRQLSEAACVASAPTDDRTEALRKTIAQLSDQQVAALLGDKQRRRELLAAETRRTED
ncbi:amino acid adenylation domain-containing protein [Synechococcus sp. EJ6-Ellesmere]|uniref:amino acid adenylation domain-containing protein n=1 Tax=Synechococcus sp. EJ6-Ellesmere TaxID=2823734 RepID=UPI0020CD5570|nr:amino acid adenylation domain-containing protein [Synechococcus sp. EJ6-Ellesmere]MCP9823850.1 amino acid adenylation domain-containing protein [Synechococcus sp. EJ6-Ellesmere]